MGLAGRYASAVLQLAEERGAVDAVAADLARLADMMAESDDLRRLVRSPIISRDDQRRAMAAVMEKAGMDALSRDFIGLLARKRRLFALADIIAAYRALLAENRGEIGAEVVAARELTEGQREALKQALKKTMGREVTVNERVDPSLLGGLVVRVGSRMLDNSLRTKLQHLHLAMKGIG